MADTPRLNGVIAALEQGKPAFVSFCAAEIGVAQSMNGASYDGVVFEMEHRPYDIRALRDCLQYILDRRQILQRGTLAPAVTPFVRIPPNGGETSQWIAKQVLDQGVYGIVWPHNPQGEILVAIMCEEVRAIKNLPKMLEEVAGIGVVIIGEGDLSQDLGFPRQYEHPTVAAAMDEILAICKQYNVPCGHPHVDAKNVESLIEQGFRWLMPGPVSSFAALEIGRRVSGR